MVSSMLRFLVGLLLEIVPGVRLQLLKFVIRDVRLALYVGARYIALAQPVEMGQRFLHIGSIPLLLIARDHLVSWQMRVLLHSRVVTVNNAKRSANDVRTTRGRGANIA